MSDQIPDSTLKPMPDSPFGGRPTTPNPNFEGAQAASSGFERTADPNRYTREAPNVSSADPWPGGFTGEFSVPVDGEFYDDFLTDEDPVSGGVRDAEPGPGQINIETGSGATFSIVGGWLIQDGGASNTAGGWWTINNFTREPGLQFQTHILLTGVGGGRFGPSPTASLTASVNATWSPFVGTDWDRWRVNGNTIDLGDGPVVSGEDRTANIILRDSGQFYIMQDKLRYLDQGDTWDPSYYQFNQNSAAGSTSECEYLLVPTARQIPNVLASDSFNRADNTDLGNTDGMGHPERHGGSGLAWTVPESPTRRIDVINGAAEHSAAASAYAILTTSSSDVVMEFVGLEQLNAHGFVARWVDIDNHLLMRQDGSGFGIFDVIGGSANQLASDSVSYGLADTRMVCIIDGDQLTVVRNDADVLGGITPTYLTGNVHGFRLAQVGKRLDDFVVWPRTPTLVDYTPPT